MSTYTTTKYLVYYYLRRTTFKCVLSKTIYLKNIQTSLLDNAPTYLGSWVHYPKDTRLSRVTYPF